MSSSDFTVNGLLISNNATDASSLSIASIFTAGGISASKTLRVGQDSIIGNNCTVNGILTCLNGNTSSSPKTGCAVFLGGIGVGRDVSIGGSLSIFDSATFLSTVNIYGAASFLSAIDSVDTSTGSIVTTGGMGIGKNVNIGGNLSAFGSTLLSSVVVNGKISISDSTSSISSDTGAIVVSGGVGVGGNINCKMNLIVEGNSAFIGTCKFDNLTDSSTYFNGAVVYAGGIGVGKNVNIGGGLSCAANSYLTGPIVNNAGSLTLNSVLLLDSSGMLYVRTPSPSLRLAATDLVKANQYVNTIDLFSLGNAYLDTSFESLQITTTGRDTYSIISRASGSGFIRRISLSTGSNLNQVLLKTDGSVSIGSVTTDSTSIHSGSVVVSGGLGVNGAISAKNAIKLFGNTSGNVTLSIPAVVTPYSLTLPSSLSPANNYALVSDVNGNLSWAQMTTPAPVFQTVSVLDTTPSNSVATGALTVKGGLGVSSSSFFGGNVVLSGPAGSNVIMATSTSSQGFGAPTYSTRSLGSRFVLYPGVGSTSADYALGIMGTNSGNGDGYMWFSADTFSHGFKWFSGVKNTLTLDGNGNITMCAGANISLTATNSTTVSLSLPDTVDSYSLTLPSSLPNSTSAALVSDENGNLGWSEMITPNPTFNTLVVNATTQTTRGGTGAMVVSGGGSFGANLAVKNQLMLLGANSGSVTLAAPDSSSDPTFTLPSSVPSVPGQVLQCDGLGQLQWTSVQTFSKYSSYLQNGVSGAPVAGLAFSDMFKIDVYVSVEKQDGILGAMLTLKGFKKSTGWYLHQDVVGDTIDISFDITPEGQVTYSFVESDQTFVSAKVNWNAPDVTLSGSIGGSAGTPLQFSGKNNQSSPADVAGFRVSPPQFCKYVLVNVTTNTVATSTATLYALRGVQQPDGTWSFSEQLITGPDPGIHFAVAPSGQIQYTSSDIDAWISTTFTVLT